MGQRPATGPNAREQHGAQAQTPEGNKGPVGENRRATQGPNEGPKRPKATRGRGAGERPKRPKATRGPGGPREEGAPENEPAEKGQARRRIRGKRGVTDAMSATPRIRRMRGVPDAWRQSGRAAQNMFLVLNAPVLTPRRPEVVSGLDPKCFLKGGARRADVEGRAGGAEARRGAAPATPEGRDRGGVPCAVTPVKSPCQGHEASSLERQGPLPQEPPREDHAPGLGYFGVKLRPDAGEVTKYRSSPFKPDPGLWTQFVSRSSPRRVSQRRNEMSPKVQPGPVGARLPDCRRNCADVCVLFRVRLVVGVSFEDTATTSRAARRRSR